MSLFAILLCSWAISDTASYVRTGHRGTAIFFEWLDDRFVVATDSLETHSDKRVTFDDCKIVVQGASNDFFTVSGGVRSATIRSRLDRRIMLDWDTQRMAAKAYKAVVGAKTPEKVAAEWQKLTLGQLNSLPIHTRVEVRDIKNNQMLFVGLLGDKTIDVEVAAFTFDGKQFDITIARPPMNKVRSIAEGEKAASVFLLHQTSEAKREDARWRATLKSTFGVRTKEDFQTELVLEVVNWAIEHPGADQVGGQVEAVRLQPNSGITWLRPCPASKKISD